MPQPTEPNSIAPVTGVVSLPKGAVAAYGSAVESVAGAGVQVVLTPSISTRRMYVDWVAFTSFSPAAQVAGTATISDGTWTENFQFVESTSAGGAYSPPLKRALMATLPGTPITITIPPIAGGAQAAIASGGYEL